jgi:hypothetical protein
MYISNIKIKNYGPIANLTVDLPFDGDRPKPLVLVGQNGSGKSLLLANIVNALIAGRQTVYDNNEVEAGKVYKYRMPSYISSGTTYSYSAVKFQSGVYVEELQLNQRKSLHTGVDEELKSLPIYQMTPPDQSSFFNSTFGSHPETAATIFEQQCCLYYPVNRNENPAWLNIEDIQNRAKFTKLKPILRYSNRDFVASSALEANRDWILDLVLDRSLYDIKISPFTIPTGVPGVSPSLQLFSGFQGPSTDVYEAILKLLRIILRQGSNVRLGIGRRDARQISILKDEKDWIPNLFQLSTGETQLLNLFLTIIKDFDLCAAEFSTLTNIKGIVVIDEIDMHLHATQQINVLPELIASFPQIQFIITTHSPLFLIGLQRKLGVGGFVALQMPTCTPVSVEEFSEFEHAYEAFVQTERHKDEIKKSIKENNKPLLYVEGDYDIRYLKRAAFLLQQEPLLAEFRIEDGGGFGNLDKIWKSYENPTSSILPHKLVLLYDCDVKKPNSEKGQIFKRTMPPQSDSPISIGIENLFPDKTITHLETVNPQFIDFQPAMTRRERNVEVQIPAVRTVNRDEKGNMCNWLCEYGTKEDFSNFSKIFDIIAEVLAR